MSSVPMPTMKLSAKDAEKIEKSRANKAELAALREQVAALQAKQESDGALVVQLPDILAELASLREAVNVMERNEKELTSELGRLKQALSAAPTATRAAIVESRSSADHGAAVNVPPLCLQALRTNKVAAKPAGVEEQPAEQPEPGLWDQLQSWLNNCMHEPAVREEEPVEVAPPEPDYDGCYLLFTEARGGAFIVRWSETELPDGAEPLAYFKPESPVAKHKYANGGQSELCHGVGGPNKKLFYQGWASYLRTACGLNGTLTLLRNVEASPVGIFVCNSDTSVLRVQIGKPLKLGADITAVAITPPLSTGLDVQTMPTRIFTAVGEKHGAAFSLDGGGDGKAEDVGARLADKKLSFSRSSRGSSRVSTPRTPLESVPASNDTTSPRTCTV